MAKRDPLLDPAPLIRRVYAYAAYRLGDAHDAEDVTSEVFERALRYRNGFDPAKGQPVTWLLGIASRCVSDALRRRSVERALPVEGEDVFDDELESSAVRRLTLADAMGTLDERAQELIALRYGADLTARQIGGLVGLSTNAVEVALHRALGRLRVELTGEPEAHKAPRRAPDQARSSTAG